MMRMGHSMLYFDRIKSIEESMKEINEVSQEDIIKLFTNII